MPLQNIMQYKIGVIQPVAEIAAVCKSRGVLLHCDAVPRSSEASWMTGCDGRQMAAQRPVVRSRRAHNTRRACSRHAPTRPGDASRQGRAARPTIFDFAAPENRISGHAVKEEESDRRAALATHRAGCRRNPTASTRADGVIAARA